MPENSTYKSLSAESGADVEGAGIEGASGNVAAPRRRALALIALLVAAVLVVAAGAMTLARPAQTGVTEPSEAAVSEARSAEQSRHVGGALKWEDEFEERDEVSDNAEVQRMAAMLEDMQAQAATPTKPSAPVTCAKTGENCLTSKCCMMPGTQCFAKDATYAGCRGFCVPGPDKWACTKLGSPAPKPEGIRKCSWAGTDCSGLKCCNDANMKCFTKDQWFAGCQFKPPKGWAGKQLGEFRGWNQVVSSVSSPGEAQGTSLYCISVTSPPQPAVKGRPATNDGALMGLMKSQKLGIYECDEAAVFTAGTATKAEWQSIANTDQFINVWEQVKKQGRYLQFDWTVKVDPDAVLFPHRLKQHLAKLLPPKDTPIYMKNTDFKFGFMGSLEIFSKSAMQEYAKHGGECVTNIGHTGGEDFFMMTCMDAMGVGTMQDIELLSDKYTVKYPPGQHLVLQDTGPCNNGWVACFHPYKDPNLWAQCHSKSWQAEQKANR